MKALLIYLISEVNYGWVIAGRLASGRPRRGSLAACRPLRHGQAVETRALLRHASSADQILRRTSCQGTTLLSQLKLLVYFILIY